MSLRSHLWIIPPALLLIVACIQPILVKQAHLNKWKGGAFAMFSTTDHYSNRFIRAYVPTEAGELPALLPDWQSHYLRIICMPNQTLLKKEALQLDAVSWSMLERGDFEPLQDNPPLRDSGPVQRVYGDNEYNQTGLEKAYPAILAPTEKLQGSEHSIAVTGHSRVEAYRLIYRGNGVIAGKRISSSEPAQ